MTGTIAETKQVIIGTAGHIDHGKTALVKALTGIDADTLAEEKRRGITIELGFVFMEDPTQDRQIVFIDVPGHEKLVKTMVAGASNIDAALLVIAADDGINAQTIEHFDILQLLGIRTGMIAMTKVDLVDPERVEHVRGAIRDFVAGSFLSEAPIVPVSSVTGEGVEEIRSALRSLAKKTCDREDSGVFRMPIDRVFTMPGFGVVVAGTVLSGKVRVGERIEVFPEQIPAKVRGIQIHNETTQESSIGRRTAINLQDVKKEQLRRGQCIGEPGSLSPTTRLDAQLFVLKSAGRELKNRDRLRIHIGTDEVICRVVLLDREALVAGETAPAQFVLESPTAALPKDRFILRTFSPLQTIGGGQILDASPTKHKRFEAHILDGLKRLEGDLMDSVEQTFLKGGAKPQSPAEISRALGAKDEEIRGAVERLHGEGQLVPVGGALPGKAAVSGELRYLHVASYDALTREVLDAIQAYLKKNAYRMWMPLADLQSQLLKEIDRQTFETILGNLCRDEKVVRKGSRVSLTGYQLRLNPGEEEKARRIEKAFRDAGLASPLEEDVRNEAGLSPDAFRNLMTCLVEQERLVRLSDKVTYHSDNLKMVQDMVARHLKANPSIAVAELRDKLGVSRKYALALLEYFDNIGLTKREGDRHVAR
jgi:selenocysteine-specific elongation factor